MQGLVLTGQCSPASSQGTLQHKHKSNTCCLVPGPKAAGPTAQAKATHSVQRDCWQGSKYPKDRSAPL